MVLDPIAVKPPKSNRRQVENREREKRIQALKALEEMDPPAVRWFFALRRTTVWGHSKFALVLNEVGSDTGS